MKTKMIKCILTLSMLGMIGIVGSTVLADETEVYEDRSAVLNEYGYNNSVVNLGNGAYCKGVPYGIGTKCWADSGEVISHTGHVVVNGWVNYGPWNPRPGFGVIIP